MKIENKDFIHEIETHDWNGMELAFPCHSILLKDGIEYSDQVLNDILDYVSRYLTVHASDCEISIPAIKNEKTIKAATLIKRVYDSFLDKCDFTDENVDWFINSLKIFTKNGLGYYLKKEGKQKEALECVLYLKDLTYIERLSANAIHTYKENPTFLVINTDLLLNVFSNKK